MDWEHSRVGHSQMFSNRGKLVNIRIHLSRVGLSGRKRVTLWYAWSWLLNAGAGMWLPSRHSLATIRPESDEYDEYDDDCDDNPRLLLARCVGCDAMGLNQTVLLSYCACAGLRLRLNVHRKIL